MEGIFLLSLISDYAQAAPTMINKMKRTTINAKPPPKPVVVTALIY